MSYISEQITLQYGTLDMYLISSSEAGHKSKEKFKM
jgi:hypothetical protein